MKTVIDAVNEFKGTWPSKSFALVYGIFEDRFDKVAIESTEVVDISILLLFKLVKFVFITERESFNLSLALMVVILAPNS